MKVWITKYALTQGPYEIEAELCSGWMVKDLNTPYPTYFHREGRDWHRTKEAALARCEAMRARKLAALEKARKRIAALDFAAMCE